MPVIHREHGLRFIIYLDDHVPAHVHVEGNGGAAKIGIGDARLIWTNGLSRRDVNRAIDVVRSRHEEFIRAWQQIHG